MKRHKFGSLNVPTGNSNTSCGHIFISSAVLESYCDLNSQIVVCTRSLTCCRVVTASRNLMEALLRTVPRHCHAWPDLMHEHAVPLLHGNKPCCARGKRPRYDDVLCFVVPAIDQQSRHLDLVQLRFDVPSLQVPNDVELRWTVLHESFTAGGLTPRAEVAVSGIPAHHGIIDDIVASHVRVGEGGRR